MQILHDQLENMSTMTKALYEARRVTGMRSDGNDDIGGENNTFDTVDE